MKTLRLIFLVLLMISCKQKIKETTTELKTENQNMESVIKQEKTEIPIDSVYKIYKKGKVEKFDWDLAFNKAEKYRKISEPKSNKKIIPSDFIEFSQKFISDSEFQKNHIDFENLIAVVGTCEETYVLKEDNWVFNNWNFIKEIGIDEEWRNTFHYSDNLFFFEYELKEVGTLTMLGFEKIDSEWNLTLYFQSDC